MEKYLLRVTFDSNNKRNCILTKDDGSSIEIIARDEDAIKQARKLAKEDFVVKYKLFGTAKKFSAGSLDIVGNFSNSDDSEIMLESSSDVDDEYMLVLPASISDKIVLKKNGVVIENLSGNEAWAEAHKLARQGCIVNYKIIMPYPGDGESGRINKKGELIKAGNELFFEATDISIMKDGKITEINIGKLTDEKKRKLFDFLDGFNIPYKTTKDKTDRIEIDDSDFAIAMNSAKFEEMILGKNSDKDRVTTIPNDEKSPKLNEDAKVDDSKMDWWLDLDVKMSGENFLLTGSDPDGDTLTYYRGDDAIKKAKELVKAKIDCYTTKGNIFGFLATDSEGDYVVRREHDNKEFKIVI